MSVSFVLLDLHLFKRCCLIGFNATGYWLLATGYCKLDLMDFLLSNWSLLIRRMPIKLMPIKLCWLLLFNFPII